MSNNNKTPAIRFKGFTDTWEQRKVGETYNVTRGYVLAAPKTSPIKTDEMPYPVYSSQTKDEGLMGYYNEYLYENAITWTTDGANAGTVNYRAGKFYCTNVCGVLLSDKGYANKAAAEALNMIAWKWVSHVGNPKLMNNVMAEIEISLPPTLQEQDKISEFLESLDHLIALHQRKYDKLIQFKAAMLKKMFPQNGANKPEIRFKGFTDAWEQRKVGEWGNFYYGHSCPKRSVTEDATTPCIRYGEMYTKFGCKIDRVYSYTNIPKENLKFSKGTEVLVPRVGEDPMDYNHCTWLSLANVAIGEMISVYNTEQNPLFTAIMFNATLKYEFAKRVEGGSVTNLYYEKLLEIPVSFPNIEEQKKIASLFENFDNLITLHQRKCDKYKSIKAGLIRKLFP